MTPTASTSARNRSILAAALVAVIVACLLVLGARAVSGDGGSTAASVDDPETRERVMNQANQFVLRVNTYGPGDLDAQDAMPEYAARVHDVITPKFRVSFDENLRFAEATVAQAGYARTVELFSSGVESLEEDTASVLVAGALNGSYPDPQREEGRIDYEPQPFRFRVGLILTQGEWLVDDFAPLTGDSADPGQVPTGPPTTAPPRDTPTSRPSSQPSNRPSNRPSNQSTTGSDGTAAP